MWQVGLCDLGQVHLQTFFRPNGNERAKAIRPPAGLR